MKNIFRTCDTILFALFLSVTAGALNSHAVSVTDTESTLFEFQHIGMQVSAVENDMRFFLMYATDDIDGRQRASEDAVENLRALKKNLDALKTGEELGSLKQSLAEAIRSLKTTYIGISSKSSEEIFAEMSTFRESVREYNSSMKTEISNHLELPQLPADFEIIREEQQYFRSESDLTDYKTALAALENQDYKKAAEILQKLLKIYENTPLEASILSRLIQCVNSIPSGLDVLGMSEQLDRLENILDSGTYQTRLFTVFEQWRSLYQIQNHGVSNWSEIPNQFYISKRWKAARSLIDHVRENPDEKWAKWQLSIIMDMPIIYRGGKFGNSNMMHYARAIEPYRFE